MASPTFGLPTAGNNAPPPTFGSMTNPTGGNTNLFGSGGNFPNYPIFGSSQTTTPMSSVSPFTTSSLSSLYSNPLADYYNNTGFWNQVGKAYGIGTGQALQTEFGQLFNPSVVQSYLAAMQPGISQGQSNILSSFGAEGSRFGSAAAYGLGQYDAGVQLNEGQLISQMYQNAVNQEINITESMMPTLHAERANQGGWLSDVIGGLETVGGIAAAPFTGGLSLGLTAQGLGTIAGANSGGGGGGGSSMLPYMMGSSMGSGLYGGGQYGSMNTGTFGANAPLSTGYQYGITNPAYSNPSLLDISGGTTLGGNNPFAGSGMLGLYE